MAGTLTKNGGEVELDKAVVHFISEEIDKSNRACLVRKVENWDCTKSERFVSVCDLTEVTVKTSFGPISTVQVEGKSCNLCFHSDNFRVFSSIMDSIFSPPTAVKDVIEVASTTSETVSLILRQMTTWLVLDMVYNGMNLICRDLVSSIGPVSNIEEV